MGKLLKKKKKKKKKAKKNQPVVQKTAERDVEIDERDESGLADDEYEDDDDIYLSGSDEQYERIFKILDAGDEEDAEVNEENLEKYFEYLKKTIELPCIVTGIEDCGCFGWEEFYTFGPGNKKEYKQLKKKHPSFTDEYEILRLGGDSEDWDYDEDNGIFVQVRRLSDSKTFSLTLSDLEAVDEKSKNAVLLNDHSVWFVNFR